MPEEGSSRRDRRPSEPGLLAWGLAAISLVLPWIGIGLCLAGLIEIPAGGSRGWMILGAGLTLIVLDTVIDFTWAHPAVSISDEPHLNRRANQMVGRLAVVAEPITAGRGKVRISDTLWVAEGHDAASGVMVRVLSAKDGRLVVAPE